MPQITFWSLERINHSPLGRLTLPGSSLGLMALCVLGFGFPNCSSYREVFSEVFTHHLFSCIFYLLMERNFWVVFENFCLEFFLLFPFKG